MLLVDAGATEFDHLPTHRLERLEIKLLRAVVAELLCGRQTGLQAISPDDFAGRQMLDQQVVAHVIERVSIQSRGERFGQTLVEFQIEDGKAQRLSSAHFGGVARQTGGVGGSRAGEQPDRFKQCLHGDVLQAARPLADSAESGQEEKPDKKTTRIISPRRGRIAGGTV